MVPLADGNPVPRIQELLQSSHSVHLDASGAVQVSDGPTALVEDKLTVKPRDIGIW
jgi:hypothetical protein